MHPALEMRLDEALKPVGDPRGPSQCNSEEFAERAGNVLSWRRACEEKAFSSVSGSIGARVNPFESWQNLSVW